MGSQASSHETEAESNCKEKKKLKGKYINQKAV